MNFTSFHFIARSFVKNNGINFHFTSPVEKWVTFHFISFHLKLETLHFISFQFTNFSDELKTLNFIILISDCSQKNSFKKPEHPTKKGGGANRNYSFVWKRHRHRKATGMNTYCDDKGCNDFFVKRGNSRPLHYYSSLQIWWFWYICVHRWRSYILTHTLRHSPLPLTNLSPPIHFPLLWYTRLPIHLVCVRRRHPHPVWV